MANVDFKKIVSDQGIPTTEAEMQQAWRTELENSGSEISNDNTYSPFWRLTSALITKPALWLVEFLIGTVMPNFYLKTAVADWAVELLADNFNLTRKAAVAAEYSLVFTRDNLAVDTVIEAGTVVQTASLNNVVYQLVVKEDTAFLPGLATQRVNATAVNAGGAFNLAAGYFSVLPETIPNIIGVTNDVDSLVVPGADQESNAELVARTRNQFGTASDYHTDSVYRALISEFAGVSVDDIYFVHDAPRGPATANAFVLFDFTLDVAQYLTDINHYITDQGNHGHGDDLVVYQMPEQSVSLVVDIWHDAALSTTEISSLQQQVTDFIYAAFRQNKSYTATLTQPYSRFALSQLKAELHAEFAGLVDIEFDQSSIVTELWVPSLDSLTINMQAVG
jgi:hypothetical protein